MTLDLFLSLWVFLGLKKNLIETVENAFLHMVDTYLKLSLQKRFLEIFRCQIVTFDISQVGYSKNNKSWVF